ncbi:hypothetical protein Tco_1282981 [Tanacetum coccineum]
MIWFGSICWCSRYVQDDTCECGSDGEENPSDGIDSRVCMGFEKIRILIMRHGGLQRNSELRGRFCFIHGDDYISTSGEALAL